MKISNAAARPGLARRVAPSIARGVASSLALAVVLSAAASSGAQAQSADELAAATANPIADLISVPFQWNSDFGLGPYDRARSILNIQPVVPFFGGKLVTRTIVPIAWLPEVSTEDESRPTGVADILFTGFYVTNAGSLMVGLGPALEIPTGGEDRGSGKWSIGPSVVVLAQPGPWTLGVLANNVWSFAGDSERADVNRGILQYFVVRQLGQGWYVNSAPILSFNWEAADGQKWVVPFGGGGGKLFFLGRLPVNTQVGAYYNAVKPDVGPDWQLRVQVQLVFPAGG